LPLQTPKELLDHDDKLSMGDRAKLCGLLQYVMSAPKSDLAPAKKKLFEIGIAKALPATGEFFLDSLARLRAEMIRPLSGIQTKYVFIKPLHLLQAMPDKNPRGRC
jgi:hypothetical protein